MRLRCLARNPEKMRSRVQSGTEIVQGDVLDPASLDRALQGVHTAYYLVHLMSGSKDFEKEDRQAATNFAAGRKEGRGAADHLPGWAGRRRRPETLPALAQPPRGRPNPCEIPASKPSSSGRPW